MRSILFQDGAPYSNASTDCTQWIGSWERRRIVTCRWSSGDRDSVQEVEEHIRDVDVVPVPMFNDVNAAGTIITEMVKVLVARSAHVLLRQTCSSARFS